MGYIEKNLISGESVSYRARLHWIVLAKPIVFSLVVVAIGALMFYLGRNSASAQGTSLLTYIVVGTLVVAVIPLLIGEIKRRSAEFTVTNKRVIFKVGAVGSQTAEMFLNKIESVRVDQTVGGRMLGYGSITVRGIGGSLEPFDLVSAPLEFRRQIQEQIGGSPESPTGSIGNRGQDLR